MKLIHFNNRSYGAEYFVMAENKEEAHKALLDYLDKQAKEEIEIYKGIPEITIPEITDDAYYQYNVWKDINPNDPTTYPKNFTIDEHEPNTIIESEIS